MRSPGDHTTKDRLQLELRDLAIKMNVLLQEGRRLCREADPDAMSALTAKALDRIEMYNDYLLVAAVDQPPGPYVVKIEGPGSDEPVRLEAAWNDEIKALRLTNVPIGLAAVARAIDASLATGKDSGIASFSWMAMPAELDIIIVD